MIANKTNVMERNVEHNADSRGKMLKDAGLKTGIWIIAVGVIITALYVGRGIMAPFAVAIFLWLVMESFARRIQNIAGFLPVWVSRLIGILVVLGGFGILLALLGRSIEDVSANAGVYESRMNELIADAYQYLGLANAPTLSQILFGETGQRFLGVVAGATSELSENLIIVLIYVAFLFVAASNWSTKLDALFPDQTHRQQVRRVSNEIVEGIESYLWTQTVISVLITLLTWVTMIGLGVENALLLAILIFVLNYIPTIGSILAAFIPVLFVIAQPSWPPYLPDNSLINTAIVSLAVSFWQFSIGNFVQPRMMGDSLNLSTLVVLLSLSIWGALWGIPGMFLSAPLTVVVMVVCNQFPSTKWISILLSADGRP